MPIKTVRRNSNPRQAIRTNRKTRISRKLGKRDMSVPRLVIYRSNRYIYGQLVDDQKGVTLVQAHTQEKDFSANGSTKDMEAAKKLGSTIAERAKAKNLTKVVFDRNGYHYHGRVKAFADAAREAGLEF